MKKIMRIILFYLFFFLQQALFCRLLFSFFSEAMFSASLFFLRLECHFHGCCTSFNFRVLLTLFMSTAPIIVKKAWHVKKKFFRKSLYSADLSTFPQEFHKKFSTEKVYLDFFQKSFTISCIQYLFLIFFWTSFFIEPVDNFAILKTITPFCIFPQDSQQPDYVIHSLCITLLITFSFL